MIKKIANIFSRGKKSKVLGFLIFISLLIMGTVMGISANNTQTNNQPISFNFPFTGKAETFIVPESGLYKIETWGAQGGTPQNSDGGYGGFASGDVYLTKGDELVITVGGSGDPGSNGYNGGGKLIRGIFYGGGATDVRASGSGLLNRIIVAGGGGAASNIVTGGFGGGLIGGDGQRSSASNSVSFLGYGGTQSAGGKGNYDGVSGTFGKGGDSYLPGGYDLAGGGGSGWYGGSGSLSMPGNENGAGGGSSYVLTKTSFRPSLYSPDSKYEFTNTEIISGNQHMINKDHLRVVGNEGNGFARIQYYPSSLDTNADLNSIKINNIEIDGFNPTKYEYDIPLTGEYAEEDFITVGKNHTNQVVEGAGSYQHKSGDQTHIIYVRSADSSVRHQYKLNFVREKSTLLKSLNFQDYYFEGSDFNPEILNYEINTFRYGEITYDFETFSDSAIVEVKGLDNLKYGENIVTVTVTNDKTPKTVYTIKVNRIFSLDYEFTGKAQEFIAPYTGKYRFDLWGAQGFSNGSIAIGGKGAFTSGVVNLTKGELVNIYVGGDGHSVGKGFNGGGIGKVANSFGGGATDIRISGNAFTNRILVAGGGGASSGSIPGGFAGGLTGGPGRKGSTANNDGYVGTPGTQTSGGNSSYAGSEGTFGLGGAGYLPGGWVLSAGGGGGWYGGSGSVSQVGNENSAAGGSSYVLSAQSHKPNGMNPNKRFYPEKISQFTGNDSIFDVDGNRSTGRQGHGHTRVTFISEEEKESSNLEMIRYKGINIPGFDENKYEYTIEIDGEYTGYDELSVVKIHDDQVVSQDIYHDITYHNQSITISVVSADVKHKKDYTINFVRENTSKLHSLGIKNYLFDGEVEFDYSKMEYSIDTFRDDPIEVEYITFDKDATVKIIGDNNLKPNTNNVIQVIVSAPNVADTVYTINVNRKLSLDYDFTGGVQTFIAPYTGEYLFENWGAEGSSQSADITGGKGGFVSGTVNLTKGDLVYVYVGGQGNAASKGFNGGGKGALAGTFGGGASDIRLGGLSLNNRVLVAGGGGGAGFNARGGDAGPIGENGSFSMNGASYIGKGGTQTAGGGSSYAISYGYFGIGGNAYTPGYAESAGGGGGWFGGSGSLSNTAQYHAGAGGGSNYILTATSSRPNGINPNKKDYVSKGVSSEIGKPFYDIDGSIVYGKSGDGHIRVTYNSQASQVSSKLEMLFYNGNQIPNFSPEVFDYTIKIPGEYVSVDELSFSKQHNSQVVVADKNINLRNHDHTEIITVISADGIHSSEYTVTFEREKSTKLYDLSVDEYKFSFTTNFKSNQYSYDLSSYVYGGIEVKADTFHKDAIVKVEGSKESELRPGTNRIMVSVSLPGVETTVYEINAYRMRDMEFGLSGATEKFSAPYTGMYKLEAWGAQGSSIDDNSIGGKGGYASGELYLRKGELIYVNVGGNGDTNGKGFNGGGISADGKSFGGGASDIRLGGVGELYRVLVAGGGGGAAHTVDGGAGGGFNGFDGASSPGSLSASSYGKGGTQIAGGASYSRGKSNGSFANGGVGYESPSSYPNSPGGGGGWFGGGGGITNTTTYALSAGGGSSYILDANSARRPNFVPSTKYYLDNGQTIPGNQIMPGKDGFSVEGNEGNGFVRIALMNLYGTDSSLAYLNFSNGTPNRSFDADVLEYDVVLDTDQTELVISADTTDHNASVNWDSTKVLTIMPGVTRFELPVTAQDGSVRIYVVRVHRTASSYSYLSNLSVDGVTIQDFEPSKLTYNLELTYDQVRKVEFDWMNARPDQLITGEKSVVLENGVPVTITVISEDGLHTSDYVITPIIEDSNLLKSLDIDEAKIEFDSNTFEYDVQVSSGISSLNIIAIPFDHEAVVTMSGNGYLRNGMNLVEITVTEPNTPVQVYTLNVNRSDTADGSVDTEYDFIYKGEVEYFEAPYTGNYKLETWGAEGGSRGSALGGKGGYSTGIVRLTQGEIVAVYVGGSGSNIQKGFNGGAISGTSNVYSGGASDVRVGEYGLYERIIVAGGGGSVGASNKAGAAGGGLNGLNNTLRYGSGGQGGTQLEAGIRGSFGQGGNGVFTNGGRTGAGGGGWYGGGGSNPDYAADDDRGGGGGSAYLFTADSVKPTGYKVDSKYYLTDIETIAGNAQLPNKDGGYVVGNSGNGFVRITSLRRASTDNNLERIELDAGVTLEPEFDTEELNYTINLGVDQTDVTIKGVPMDPLATIIGNGNYDVPTPGIDVNLIVTSESGDIKTYSIRVNRSSSSNSLPQDVMISGLVPSLCDVSEDYCKENPEFTSADTIENGGGTYYLTVPSRIRSLEFNVIKGHEYQEVTGAGIVELDPGDDNIVYIEVASEDETSFSSYIFNITRDMTGNADLDTIDITYPERDLEFNPDVTEYYFSVPNDIDHTDKMDWTYATMDDQANAILEGEGDLSLGNNELKITVVASNGLTKVYKLFIYREDSSNTFLNRLIVTHDEKALLIAPSFNKVLHDYVLSVENEVSSVTIIAEAEEPDTTTVINGEDGVHELIVGQNNIEIKTTAQDGTSAVYSISIVRKPSSNAAIQSLTILGEEVDTFNPDLLLQTIVVDSQTTRPELEVVLDNEFASYTITGSYRVFGKGANTVHIRVTAEDGTIRNYTIIFDKVISDDSSLSSVSSNLFDIDTRFDPEVTEYDINIPYSETQMIMGGIPTHHTSKILGLGGYYLTSGMNSVKLEVIAEDNTSTTYTFNINMLKNTNPELKELTTNVGVFDPGFSSKVTEYAINVPNEASKITVSGVSFIASTVVEGLGEYVLNTGPNVIKVIAKAENGKTITYTLNITRDVSSNADLSYLIVHEGALSREFMPGIIEYDIAVPARTSRVTIEAAVQDPFATYTILNATNLKPGNNTVIVRVTPQDKIGVKDYTLNVYVQEEASENINLTNLRINPGKLNPDFLPARQFYRVSVGNDVTSINVEAIVGNNATLVGNGDYDLKVGNNLIVVKTKAANGVTKDYQIEVKRAPSTETRLKSFGVSGLNSSHTFRPDTYNYSGTTFRTSLGFNPIPMHENATVEVIGNHSFVTNSKTVIVIRVTAEDGITTKDYLFTVSKYASENNNLKTLSISGIHFTPEFTPGRTTYTAQADENTTQVVLTAVTEDVNAKIEMEKVHNLTFGENFIDITVVSEKGTRRKYTVVIDKAGSRVRDLKSLSVDGESVPDFDKDTLEYDYEYLYETESIFVDYELTDTKATISGVGEIPLTVGMNVLPVVVTSEHGDIKTYKLNVMRKAINSAEIETLKIDQYPIDNGFNPSIETYNLVIDNEFSALRFDIALKDKKAKFEITGNENLVVGNNIVRVKVTSSEGDKEKTYTFNVYKQEFGNNTLAYLDVDKESLKPSFFGGIMVYEVDLSYEFDEITFTGETDEKSASVANLGTKSLEYGVNHFKFPVRANNGVVRTYHVFVNRLRSNDNYINSMRVEAGGKVYDYTPEFDPKVNEYTLKEDVAPGTEAINLVLSSNVEGVSGTHRIPITVGTNKIEYVVTSDSGLKNTYIINLNRPASSNNSLTNIIPSAGGLAPNFIYSENEYKLNVDTTTTTLSFGVTTEDRNATVSGNDRKIVDVGESTRVITVTAENGEKKDYTITVVKSDTNNAYLDELSVVGYELKQNFDSHVFTYDLVVPNSKSIIHANEIIYKTSDSSAQKRVELTGSLNLLTGAVPNVFEVRVTAVDGFTSETYRINIIRESSSEAIIETLEFDKGTLNKRFSSYTYEYDLEFGSYATHFNKNMIKRLVLSDLSGVVSYSHEDDIKLEEGVVTPFTITVTSEDGTNVKNYVFNITYTRSRDNKLANIQIENAQFIPEFKPDILEYEVGVHEDITSVVMKAFPRDPKAKLLSVVGEQELINHTTLFEVKIQAENGDVVTYKLHIKRNLSKSLVLKDIGLTDAQGAKLTSNFDNFFNQYEAVVPKDLNHVGLIVVKGHESQELTLFDKFNNQVDINKFDLAIGRNDFKLEVRSPFGDLRTINFRIMRDGNSNNYLDSLNVTDPTTDIDFNKDKMEYFVEVPNSYDQIVLNYKQEDPTAKVTVHNNSYLKEGTNDVIVRVTAENGDTRNYVIHVFRAAKYNNFLNQITVSVGGNVISQDPKFFTPNFHRGTTNYVVKVGSTIDVVTVQGTPFSDDIIVTGQSDTKIAEADRGIEIKVNPGNNIVKLLSQEPTDGNVLIYTVNIIREMSDDVTLKSLELFADEILLDYEEGAFDSDRNFYTTSVAPEIDKLLVVASPQNPNARVNVTGHETLLNGENLIKVSVTSEDRTKTKVYTALVKKNLSGDNTLSGLNITDSDKPVTEFDMSDEEFTYTVGKDVDTVIVGGTLSDPMADINGLGTHSVIHGENKLNILVKAQNGEVKTYTVTVIREFDNSLESLRVNQGELSPEFDAEIFDYTVWVPLAVDRINIEGIAKNAPIAVVSGNGWYDLKVGSDNLFKVSVQSGPNDTAVETTIKVIRSASPNTDLAVLDIEQGLISPKFDSKINEYETYIKDSNSSIDLIIVPEDSKATYEIVDNPNVVINATDKSKVKISQINDEMTTITIRVTAENGDSEDTILRVHRQPAALFSNLLSSLEVSPIKTMSPTFKSTTNNYIAIVDEAITFVTIKATKVSAESTIVSGVGTFPVQPGRNVFNIVVRSKDGVDNIYKVTINQVVSADSSLSNLSFDEGFLTPIFSRPNKSYSINVGASTNFLTPHVTPYANGTKWEITGPGVTEDLKMGENAPVEINTIAANGVATDKYTVKVNKTNQTSVYLKELTSNIGTFNKPFDKYQEGPYRLEIGADVNSIILDGKAEEPLSIKSITGMGVIDMSQSNNKTVEIVVTGNAGNKMTYYVEIVKALNDDVKLSYLAVNPGALDPVFSSNQSLYNVNVGPNVDSIEILANTTGQAIVTGTGVKTLVSGKNTFTVTLTTDSGSIGVYTIIVDREAVQSAKILELRFNEALIENPIFDKDDTQYQLSIPYEVEALTINHILLEDPTNAEYEIIQEPSQFVVGLNDVKLTVTNKVSGDTMTYNFTVTRQQFSSNFLTSLSTDKGLLTPAFDKVHNYYDIDVPYDTTEIKTIGTIEDGQASVSGIGPHRDLKVGVNEIKITVTSVTGVPRVYIVRVNRLLDSSKDLLTLNVEGGSLSPAFGNSEFNEYTVNVPEDNNKVTFTGTIPDTATATGLETITITSPQMSHQIVVTAQDGTTKTYKFTIKKQLSPDANVISITPSTGDLDPNFEQNVNTYDVIVDDEINKVGFDVVTSNNFAVVTGNEEKQLQYGDNIFTIKVVSENGLQSNEYTINVIRLKDIHSLEVSPENLVLNVNDKSQLELLITPIDASNTDVTWTSDNNDVVSVDENGLITANKVGNAVITVSSTKNSNIKSSMVVEVLKLELESSILDVVKKEFTGFKHKKYVIGSDHRVSIDEYIEMFDNERSTLKVFNFDDKEITDLSENISTDFVIKLIVNNIVYDEALVVVRGDLDRNGLIQANDLALLRLHFSYEFELSETLELAIDLDFNEIIQVNDFAILRSYLTGDLESLNQKGDN